MKHIAIALLCTLAVGCASPEAIPDKYELSDSDRLAPINLDIYAGEYITPYTSEVVQFIQQAIAGSNLFAHVQTGYSRWPYSVHVKYEASQDMSVMEFAGVMVSSATLLLVPAPFNEEHRYEFEIYAERQLIGRYSYTEEVKTAMSLYHNAGEDRKNGAKAAIRRFFDDLMKDGVIPSMSQIQEPQRSSGADSVL